MQMSESFEEGRNSLRTFYEEYPLLSKYDTSDIFTSDLELRTIGSSYLPRAVRLDCPVCKLVNPFRHVSNRQETSSPNPLMTHTLSCTGCSEQTASFFLELDPDLQWVRKVGQLPQWDISLDPDLEEALETDADLYKRAKICVWRSFGVGACTYLRRVLENRITPLLGIIQQNKVADGAPPEEVARIDEIIQGRTADEKIKLAREVLPETLLVEGDNPLGFIYDQLSAAIHRRDELECTDVARELLDPVRDIVVYLRQEKEQRRRRRGFGETIRGLRKRLQRET